MIKVTINGTKTFVEPIIGDIIGNASTVTGITDVGSGRIITLEERDKLNIFLPTEFDILKTEIDLSFNDVYTKTEIDNSFNNVYTKTEINNSLSILDISINNKVSKTEDESINGIKTFNNIINANGNINTANINAINNTISFNESNTNIATFSNTSIELKRNTIIDGSLNVGHAAIGSWGNSAEFSRSNCFNSGDFCLLHTSEGDTFLNAKNGKYIELRINNSTRLSIDKDQIILKEPTTINADLTVTGNINGNASTVTNGIYTTSKVTELSDITDAGSGAIITATERTKLNNIENNADVTDASNVLAAGAVMTSGEQTISGTKIFYQTISGNINGNAESVTHGIYTTSKVTELSDITDAGSGAIITATERTKLNNIEEYADVTDASNVLDAGAVMTSGEQTISGTKIFYQTISGNINGNAESVTHGIYTTSKVTELSDITDAGSGAIITATERTKLNNIENNADVTDASNVLAAGAVMTSGEQTISGIKNF